MNPHETNENEAREALLTPGTSFSVEIDHPEYKHINRCPEAVRASKQLWERAPELSDAEALKLETELQLPLMGSPNQMEAVQANFQKRPPVFSDPE